MALNKLILTNDVPEIIALTKTTGTIQASKIPDTPSDVRFTLIDGRTAFFPFNVADQIRAAGIQPGVPFEITQLGNKTKVRIRNIGVSRDYTPELEKSIVNANANRNGNGARSAPPLPTWDELGAGEPIKTTPAAPVTTAALSTTQPASAPHFNGNTGAPGQTETQKMMECFLVAIDALAEAQAHCARKSFGITFTSDNVTSAALSCYIGKCRNGGAR